MRETHCGLTGEEQNKTDSGELPAVGWLADPQETGTQLLAGITRLTD